MLRAFVCSGSAVLVFPWYEPDAGGDERGARVELRLLRPTPTRGSRSAAQELSVDRPVWRADLFELVAGDATTLTQAHFHPSFDGVEPCERCWDPQLSDDPFGWLADQLRDTAKLVEASGVECDAADTHSVGEDATEIALRAAEIIDAARVALGEARDGHRYPRASDAHS